MYSKLRGQKEANPFRNALKPMNQDVKIIVNEDKNRVKFIKDSEKEAFAKWINLYFFISVIKQLIFLIKKIKF